MAAAGSRNIDARNARNATALLTERLQELESELRRRGVDPATVPSRRGSATGLHAHSVVSVPLQVQTDDIHLSNDSKLLSVPAPSGSTSTPSLRGDSLGTLSSGPDGSTFPVRRARPAYDIGRLDPFTGGDGALMFSDMKEVTGYLDPSAMNFVPNLQTSSSFVSPYSVNSPLPNVATTSQSVYTTPSAMYHSDISWTLGQINAPFEASPSPVPHIHLNDFAQPPPEPPPQGLKREPSRVSFDSWLQVAPSAYDHINHRF